jgi:hypothetical protein
MPSGRWADRAAALPVMAATAPPEAAVSRALPAIGDLNPGQTALAALPDVIVGHLRRYSPRLTHNHEKDGKSAGRMRA